MAQGTTNESRIKSAGFNITIPTCGNSWVINDIDKTNEVISANGIEAWADPKNVIRTYFYVKKPCLLSVGIEAKVTLNSSSIKVKYAKDSTIINLQNKEYLPIKIGNLKIACAGYYYIDLQGLTKSPESFAEVKNILLGNEADSNIIKYISDDFYFGRRGPSVHLFYEIPSKIQDIEWFYNEIEVPVGQDVIGSYFMTNGFSEGYFGIQVNSPTERKILFSVWSSYNTDNPAAIPSEYKIQLSKKGEYVTTKEFGDEGSGGQSFLSYNWKPGVKYKFLLHGKPLSNNTTAYTAYFYDPLISNWALIACFIRPKTDTYLKGLYSFVENFIPETGAISRKARYYNQWVMDKKGNWYELNTASLSADNTAHNQHRLDFSGGIENNGFYLRNCGFTNDSIEIGTIVSHGKSNIEPKIDFSKLP